MKRIIIAMLIMSTFLFIGCLDIKPKADEIDAEKQEQSLREAQSEIGLPAISHYQEKKDLKTIYELRDRADLINYCYLFSEQTGKAIYVGKCIGYGIPYSTQYSNPSKIIDELHDGLHDVVIPQAEPNGLFMPATADGTWVMMLSENGDIKVAYYEPRIIITPIPIPDAIGGPNQTINDSKATLRNIGKQEIKSNVDTTK